MKFVAAARSSLGVPTIFNLLGPLTNPARARHQLLGVFSPDLTDKLAAALAQLGSDRAWVVHAEDGLDELSTMGPTRISDLQSGHVRTWNLDPADLGLPYARLSDLQVKTVDEAADALVRVLSGEKGPMRDIASLNAAAALLVAGAAPDLKSALETVQSTLDAGRAKQTLDTLVACSNSG
jgi:anthranilate phosphoribosyltransferase